LDKKFAIVQKFKDIFGKITEDESSEVLYLYLMLFSAAPITSFKQLPNNFTELNRYVPSMKPPLKNIGIVYGQLYFRANSKYTD